MQKSLVTRIGEAIDQHRQVQQRETVLPPDSPGPRRLPGLLRWFLPNGGTLLLIALLIFTQNVWAGQSLRNLAAESAASTGTIAYQGRLADSSGNPLTQTLNMSFRLYNAASGGAPLWTEQWTGSNGVQVSDGLFNVMLGSLTPIPQNVITGNSTLFLGITVGTDDEMSPRVQLGSVPFAVQALTVPDGSITKAKLAEDVSLVPPPNSITTTMIIDGAITNAKLAPNVSAIQKFEGFSYFVKGFAKPAGWVPLVINTLEYNTFGGDTFDTATGIFTAPKKGYYLIRTHGWIPTGGVSNERIGIGILKNNGVHAFAGGQFSAVDTPGPSFSQVLYLQPGDTIQITSYTPIAATFGGGAGAWWFQGEFVGE